MTARLVGAAIAMALIAAPEAAHAVLPGVTGKLAVFRDVRSGPDDTQPTTQLVTQWPDGTDPRVVATDANRASFMLEDFQGGADIAPDGRVAFLVGDGVNPATGVDRGNEVALANADGTGKAILTNLPEFDYALRVAWAPDGSELLVDVQRQQQIPDDDGAGTDTVALVEVRAYDPVDGSHRLVASAGDPGQLEQAFGATWSPGGDHIAFYEDDSPAAVIRVARADGTGTVTVDDGEFRPVDAPAFAAGGRVVFPGRPDAGGNQRLISAPVPGLAPPDAPPAFCLGGCGTTESVLNNGSLTLVEGAPDGALVWATVNGPSEPPPPAPSNESSVERALTVTIDTTTGQVRTPLTRGRMLGGVAVVDAPPVIYLPGFLGSELECRRGAVETPIWPRLPSVPALDLALAADGETNAPLGEDPCPEVRLTGDRRPVDDPDRQISTGMVESVAGGDVYGSAVTSTRAIMGRRAFFFPWDWRKAASFPETLARLDAFVDRAKAASGTDQVQLVGHSYGGLLARTYVADPARRAKVARVMTLATPYWGSPKTFFPLAAGVETAMSSVLDVLFRNDEMQQMARNLQGAFFLYPSASYGGWLHVDGRGAGAQDAAGVREVVEDLGGNAALLDKGLAAHASTLDAIDVPGVPWRAVTSGEVPTVSRVFLLDVVDGVATRVGLQFDQGDGTVPLKSQTLGGGGSGADVTTVCNVEHVPLGGDPRIFELARPYLVSGEPFGDVPPELAAPCLDARGTEIVAFGVDLAAGASDACGEGNRAGCPGGARAAGPSVSPLEAERLGLVDVMRFRGQTTFVIPDGKPLTLGLAGSGLRFVVRRLDGTTKGPGTEYRPGTATATLDFGGSGTPAVEGVSPEPGTVAADDVTRGPAPPATTTAAAPKPSSTTTPAGVTSPPVTVPAPPTSPPADRTAPRTKAKIVRRGKRFRITLTARDAGGVARISFRIGKGRQQRYRRTLVLTRRQARALRFFAVDRVGNREQPRRLSLR